MRAPRTEPPHAAAWQAPASAVAVAAAASRQLAPGMPNAQAPRRGRSRGEPGEPLVVPLSSRELDVLRLLGSDLDGPCHRPPPQRVPADGTDPHPAHLRQARREQPPRRRPTWTPAAPLTPAAADAVAGKFIIPLITCDDARSSPRFLLSRHEQRTPLALTTVAATSRRLVRDPHPGPARRPLVHLARRPRPFPHRRRHDRPPRTRHRPGSAARTAAQGPRPRAAAPLSRPDRTRPAAA